MYEVVNERPIQSFMDLRVWNEAMDLVEACYQQSKGFPKQEMYGLTAQLRRAAVSVPANAVSVPANIAEGFGRDTPGSYVQHLKIAQGSLREVQTHVILAEPLKFAEAQTTKQAMERCETVAKMLNGLIRSLQRHETHE